MADGIMKNLGVVGGELSEWADQMKLGIARFKDVSIRLDKTNVLHLLQNLVTETIRALPRTLGYCVSVYALFLIVRFVAP